MCQIETEIWIPNEEKKGWLKYVGQRKAAEVFRELEEALKKEGLYPPEYFSLSHKFPYNGNELFPQMADLHCYAHWGSNEGIYINVEILHYNTEIEKYETISFATGKSLGESIEEFDRMQYIAGYIYRLFMGDGRIRSRYIRLEKHETAKNQYALVRRVEVEAVEMLKKKMYKEGEEPQKYAAEAALKLMIMERLTKCHLPEHKIEELYNHENILDYLCTICKPIMEANAYEIEDILMSSRSFSLEEKN